MLSETILDRLAAILGKDAPEAYKRGYRDSEVHYQSRIEELEIRIKELEYTQRHLTGFITNTHAHG